MGYQTCYRIEWTTRISKDNALIEAYLKTEEFYPINMPHHFGNPNPTSWGESTGHWDYFPLMKNLSKKFPKAHFILHGKGEECGDKWKHHFINGRQQECYGKIVIPKFDPKKLRPIK